MAKTGKRKIVIKSKKNINNKKRTKKINKKNRKTRKNIKKGGKKTCTERFKEDPSFSLSACLESQKIEKERLDEIERKRKIAEKKEAELQILREDYNKKKEEYDNEVMKPESAVTDEDYTYQELHDNKYDKIYHPFDRWLFLYHEDEYKKHILNIE
jgi:hypothetical protein